MQAILKAMDKDGNGKVTQKEFEAVGLAGLPNFDELGAEGHHYDVESGMFLSHRISSFNSQLCQSSSCTTKVHGTLYSTDQPCSLSFSFSEQYHSTPETQTDESYTHPEDLEHFAQHEAIEHKEAEREAKFQGITVEEALLQHEEHEHDEAPPAPVAGSNDADNDTTDAAHPPTTKKIQRQTPPEKQDPAVRFRDAKAESERHGDWGSGDAGYKPPNTPSEKMRKNLPYKVSSFFSFLIVSCVGTLTTRNVCSINSVGAGAISRRG